MHAVREGAPYALTEPWLDERVRADGVALVAHGDDACAGADGADAYAVPKRRGIMRVVRRTAGVSTTQLIAGLLRRPRSPLSSPSTSSAGLIGAFSASALRDTAARLGRAPLAPENAEPWMHPDWQSEQR